MINKKIIGLLVIILSIQQSFQQSFQSRAFYQFPVNDELNTHLKNEFGLGINYLNASVHMHHDRQALYGFGKMFKKFWTNQLEYLEKITDYIVKRGGNVTTPEYVPENPISLRNNYENEKILIKYFLHEEKEAYKKIVKLHPKSDPATADYLEEHFLSQKIERIKFLADLVRKIQRIDRHVLNKPGVHDLNPLGIYMLDKELEEQFNQ